MRPPPSKPPPAEEWTTFADARRRKLTMGLALTPAQRLQWLEDAVAFAAAAGALPRKR